MEFLLAATKTTTTVSPFDFVGVFGVIFVCIYIFFAILMLVGVVVWIWMLIDLVQRDDSEFGPGSSSDRKLIWLLVLLFTSWIGGIVYYFAIHKKYPRK